MIADETLGICQLDEYSGRVEHKQTRMCAGLIEDFNRLYWELERSLPKHDGGAARE